MGPTVYCLYLIRLERTVNRTHLSGSTFSSVAWRPWLLVRTVLELAWWGSGYQIELTGQKLNNAAMFWIVLDWFIMTQTMIESKGRRKYFTCQIKSSKFTFSTMLLHIEVNEFWWYFCMEKMWASHNMI